MPRLIPNRLPSVFTRLDRLFALRGGRAHAPHQPGKPFRLGLDRLEDRVVPDGRPLPIPVIYAGTGEGPPPVVRAWESETGRMTFERLAADPTFTGGVRVATADFTRDGYPDLVTALGPGGEPVVRVLDGKTGDPVPGPLGELMAYVPWFDGGVQVAAADVDGDTIPDLITAAGAGGGPHVQVYNGADGSRLASFFAFEPDFAGGVTIAAADFTGDGRAELVVGAGAGGAPRVRVLDMTSGAVIPGPVGDFFAFDLASRAGVSVGADWKAGDIDADGTPDLVAGSGPGGPSRVRAFSGATGAVLGDFSPFGPGVTAGVRVGLQYADDDKYADVVAATGPGVEAQVRVFRGATGLPALLPVTVYAPFGPGATGGVNLATSNDPPTAGGTSPPPASPPPGSPPPPASPPAPPSDGGVRIELNGETATKGEPATFTVVPDGTTTQYVLVEWNFDYKAATFTVDASGAAYSATTTYPAKGAKTVAARLTPGGGGAPQTITTPVTIRNPPPVITYPAGQTVAVGQPIPLPVAVTAESMPVTTDFMVSFNGEPYRPDPTASLTTPYNFPTYGTYAFRVTATDADGGKTDGWFEVHVGTTTPTATVSAEHNRDEGQWTSFTIKDLTPDTLDAVTIFARWDNKPDAKYEEVQPSDWWVNEFDGSVTFYHTYPQDGKYTATIRVEEDGARTTHYDVPVVVNKVPLRATLTAGGKVAEVTDPTPPGPFTPQNPFNPGNPNHYDTGVLQNAYLVGPGGQLSFQTDIKGPFDKEHAEYHWKLANAKGSAVVVPGGELGERVTKTPYLSLPDYTDGAIYTVEAWVENGAGEKANNDKTEVFTIAVTNEDGIGRTWGTAPRVFGTLSVRGLDEVSAFNRYEFAARLRERPEAAKSKDTRAESFPWPAQTPPAQDPHAVVTFTLDDPTLALATARGATVEYRFGISIYNVEQHSIGNDDFELIGFQYINSPVNTIHVPYQGLDRQVTVKAWAVFLKDGHQIYSTADRDAFVPGATDPPGPSAQPVGGATVVLLTPKTTTTAADVSALYAAAREAAGRFGSKAPALVNAVAADPGKVLRTLMAGFGQAVEKFRDGLYVNLRKEFYQTFIGNIHPDFLALRNWTDDGVALNILLNYAGLTWDKVYEIAVQELGAGNLAALEDVAAWFERAGTDPADPRSLLKFLEGVPNLDLAAYTDDLLKAVRNQIEQGMARVAVQVAAKFVPGLGMATSLYKGLTWVADNIQPLAEMADKFGEAIDEVIVGHPDQVAQKLYDGFVKAIKPLMKMAASQLGLGDMPDRIKKAVDFVPGKIDQGIRTAIRKLAAKATGLIGGGVQGDTAFTGIMGKAVEFAFDGKGYALFAADKVDVGKKLKGFKIKVAVKNNAASPKYDFVVAVTQASFIGARAPARMKQLEDAARALQKLSTINPSSPPTRATIAALKAAQADVEAALKRVQASIQANACVALGTGCFAAGTKLLTPDGWRAVEDLRHGDRVMARSEYDPAGPAEPKAVEDTFRRTGRILHLHAGGRVIRTTPEHPFWAEGEGWTPAGALKPGDRIGTLDGPAVGVEEVYDTGRYEAVYNLRVADHHTYFVGDADWGWAAWAHNAYEFLSGLKVAEDVLRGLGRNYSQPNLATDPDSKSIIQTIREDGVYGAMGNHAELVRLLVSELGQPLDPSDPARPSSPLRAVQGHITKPCIKDDREREEFEITQFGKKGGGRPSATLPLALQQTPGQRVWAWTAYIYTNWSKVLNGRTRQGLGDRDARNVAYETARGEIAAGVGVHGHHIVFKLGYGAAGQAAARESRDILLYHSINPYWGKENLAYAPDDNRGHNDGTIQNLGLLLHNEFYRLNQKSTILQLLRDEAVRWIRDYR